MSIVLNINGTEKSVNVPEDTPLLWVIREEIGLKGTKFGCGMGLCGACTVHLNGVSVRSCVTPVQAAAGSSVTTIEGLAIEVQGLKLGQVGEGEPLQLHPLQEAWIAHSVPQCGYCQSGQIMAAAELLRSNSNPSDEEIKEHMSGNLCRCGAYSDIHAAIRSVADKRAKDGSSVHQKQERDGEAQNLKSGDGQ